MGELAAAFGMSSRTLRRHCDAGNISYHLRGLGRTSRHRLFDQEAAVGFWNVIQQGDHKKRRKGRRKV